ncbi:MAG: isoamylase early set domain-containing protein [Bacteroidales bacterium]|nr:isoamylase early set domain-containing protein [Bacteroidales bacterium]
MAGRPRKSVADAAAEPKAKKETAPKKEAAKKETAKKASTKKASKTTKFKLTLTNAQAQNAQKVTVAGEFNEWDKEATPMTKTLEGFEVELSLENGKKYQFRYVLDGATWINDPYRPTVDNGMGEQNSVLDAAL